MKIEIPLVQVSTPTQPAAATILAANIKRADAIITNVAANTFYIRRGTGASSSVWDYMLTSLGQTIIIENYDGIITCSPTPTAGQINVAEGVGNTN